MPLDYNDFLKYKEEHPYLATWCDTVEEADKEYEGVFVHTGWINWNGVSMTPPKFVRYQGRTYTFEEFRKEIWNFNNDN